MEGVQVGIDKVMNSENIAIVVLFIVMMLQWVVIGKLLQTIFKMKDVLSSLANAIAILNERLNNHD